MCGLLSEGFYKMLHGEITMEFREAEAGGGDLTAEQTTVPAEQPESPEVVQEALWAAATQATPAEEILDMEMPEAHGNVRRSTVSAKRVVPRSVASVVIAAATPPSSESPGSSEVHTTLSTETSSSPALEQGGGGKEPPRHHLLPTGGNEDDGHEQGDRPDEAAESQEQSPNRFNALLESVLHYREELKDVHPVYRVIGGDENPEVVVLYLQPPDTDEAGAKPKGMAFSLANPDERIPTQDLPPDSPWHGAKHEGDRPSRTHALGSMPNVLHDMAKIAPNPEALDTLVGTYKSWLIRRELQETGDVPKRPVDPNAVGAKAIVLGAMRQYDLAQQQGKELALDRFFAPLADAIHNHGPAFQKVPLDSLVKGILFEEKDGVRDSFEWEVSPEAACAAASELPLHNLARGGLLFNTLVSSGLIFKKPRLSEAFHSIMTSEKGREIAKVNPRPRATAERYMVELLESYQSGEEASDRRQGVVQEMLRLRSKTPGPRGRIERGLPVGAVLNTAWRFGWDGGPEVQHHLTLEQMARVGDAFSFLLEATYSANPEIAARQHAEDMRHKENIDAIASAIPHALGRRS